VSGRPDLLLPIADFQLAPPPTWAKIPVAPQKDDWPTAVAERLLDDDVLRQALATVLTKLHGDLLGPDAHAMAMVWVPNPTRGHIEGVLTVDLVLPDPGAPLDLPYFRALSSGPSGPSLRFSPSGSMRSISRPVPHCVSRNEPLVRSAGSSRASRR
jgi:hypothetical protein